MSQIKHGIWPYLSHRPRVWHLCVKTQGLWDKRLCVLLSSLVFRLFRYNILSHKMDGASVRRPLIIYYGIQDGCTHALWILIKHRSHAQRQYTHSRTLRKHTLIRTCVHLPILERVLERSMMPCLLGLFRTDRLAREMSAVTRVIDILGQEWGKASECAHRSLKKMTSKK